ncbi:MAG: hypothetical protein ACD_26C00027G0001, partial [uncultured bacterium]
MRQSIPFEIFAIYFMPVILILSGALPFKYRFIYLVIICTCTIFSAIFRKYSLSSLGLSFEGLATGLKYNISLSVIFLLFYTSCWYFDLFGREYIPDSYMFYLFYIFISCPLQEFTYRSYFFKLLDDLNIRQPLYRIGFNSI